VFEEIELLKRNIWLSWRSITTPTGSTWRASMQPKTHDGYFSIDKKTNRLKDPAVGARSVEPGQTTWTPMT
jgi:type III restriction enzyme